MNIPYNIAAKKFPTKFASSPECTKYGICGALGLLDHDISKEPGAAQGVQQEGETLAKGRLMGGNLWI